MIDNVIDSIVSPETTHQPIQSVVKNATALLGYQYGNSWPTYAPFARARPDLAAKGWIVSVTLTCTGRSRCYDIEAGGGHNENIGVFMHYADRTWGLPWLYTFASNVSAMVNAAASFGYQHGRDYYILAAHPNTRHGKHLCAPNVCGYPTVDGTQWLFHGDYDASVLSDHMLPRAAPIPQPPTPPEGTVNGPYPYTNADGRVGWVVGLDNGEVKHIEQKEPNGDWWKNPDGTWDWLSKGNPTK